MPHWQGLYKNPYPEQNQLNYSLSFPFPFLTCFAILPTSFGGKVPHLRRRLVAQPHQTVSQLRFFGVLLSCKANVRRSVHSPRIISFSSLSLATEVTDATLGTSGLWLGTRTGAVVPQHQLKAFLAVAHGSMENRPNSGPYLFNIHSNNVLPATPRPS